VKPEQFCFILPLAAGVGVLAIRVGNAEAWSKKLGTAAVGCGVAGFIPALLGPAFKDPDQAQALAACGLFTLLLATAAIVLAVWALRVRRRDHGVDGRYPVAGMLCGAANLFCGAGAVMMGSGLMIPTGGTPWTWRAEKDGFEVTVPSERWALKPNPNVLAEFSSGRPPLAALVAEARPAGSDEEYRAVLAYGKRVKADTPTTETDERSGPNRHGHPHWVYMGDAKAGDKPYFFGISITRVRDKAVIMMFEGPYRMTSQAGHEQEARALRTQADLFLGSVK